MTSLAHLVGMIYDLKSKVDQHIVNQSLECETSNNSIVNSVTLAGNNYQISLDVSEFKASEISVKVKDQEITVCAQHDERAEPSSSSFVSRQFTRRYILPDTFDPNTISSSVDDSKLTIRAEKSTSGVIASDRYIPIHYH
jgi:HSP20 family molecular chaperone IbpA